MSALVDVEGSGTQAASIGVEHTLHQNSGAKVLTLLVDVGAMLANDIVELRIYATLLLGGTERLAQFATYGPNVQVEHIKQSIPFPAPGLAVNGWKATLKQVAGTGRDFPWVVVS